MSTDAAPISFGEWNDNLTTTALPAALRNAFRREIVRFLHHCKVCHTAASVTMAKTYLSGQRPEPEVARAALRWFVTRGRAVPGDVETLVRQVEAQSGAGPVHQACARPTEPLPAANDQGGAPWERTLITALRDKGLLWRTEQAYRAWARRFVRFIAPRSPATTEASDIGAFLTALAVQQRASQSTHRVYGFANAVHSTPCITFM